MKKYLLLLLLPILTYASIGKITVLKGDVEITRGSDVLSAKFGTKVEKNDFIKTSKTGKVQIVFSDKTIFTIGKSSTLDIADYLYDETKPKQNRAKFNVLKGAFSSITGRIGKLNKSKFKLKTRSASIGIRGTIVKASQDTILCTQGAITVTSNNGVSVDIEAGYKTDVSSGTPTAPAVITTADEESLDIDVTTKDEAKDINTEAKEEKTQKKKTEEKSVAKNDDNEKAPVESVVPAISDVAEEVVSEINQNQDVETRDVTLGGRTIEAQTGKQQYVDVEIENLGGALTLDGEENMVMTDNQGNVIHTSEESTVWGHWADNPTKKWIVGDKTSENTINSLRQNEQVINANYQGNVMGTVNSDDAIKLDNANDVNINFELGAGKNNMDGTIKFDTESGQNWDSSFSGTTSGSTFTNTDPVSGSTSNGAITSGNVDGQFYGSDAQDVGGTFDMNNDGGDKATGVFKATK